MICSILKLSIDLIRRYIVLYFLPKTPHLLPTNGKITRLVSSQNDANIPSLVPIWCLHSATNPSWSAAEFLLFRRPVEWALECKQDTIVLRSLINNYGEQGGGGVGVGLQSVEWGTGAAEKELCSHAAWGEGTKHLS